MKLFHLSSRRWVWRWQCILCRCCWYRNHGNATSIYWI